MWDDCIMLNLKCKDCGLESDLEIPSCAIGDWDYTLERIAEELADSVNNSQELENE